MDTKQDLLESIHQFYEEHVELIKTHCYLESEFPYDENDMFEEYIHAYAVLFHHDREKGIDLLKQSYSKGNDFAALTLAEIYRSGDIVPLDKEESLSWLEKYAEMETCLYVMDRMYPVVDMDIEEHRTLWNYSDGTIYAITPHRHMQLKELGLHDIGVEELGFDEIGMQLFSRFFEMIKYTHCYKDKIKFRFDTGQIITTMGDKSQRVEEYDDLDLVLGIKEILKGLEDACDEMIPALDNRDTRIRSIAKMKENYQEMYIEEKDL